MIKCLSLCLVILVGLISSSYDIPIAISALFIFSFFNLFFRLDRLHCSIFKFTHTLPQPQSVRFIQWIFFHILYILVLEFQVGSLYIFPFSAHISFTSFSIVIIATLKSLSDNSNICIIWELFSMDYFFFTGWVIFCISLYIWQFWKNLRHCQSYVTEILNSVICFWRVLIFSFSWHLTWQNSNSNFIFTMTDSSRNLLSVFALPGLLGVYSIHV